MMHAFNQYFEIVPAISKELKDEVYRLRYQVYCVEVNILDSSHCVDAMEIDDFDKHSVHYLVRHKASGEFAASTRLILPDHNDYNHPFQLETYCKINGNEIIRNIDRRHLAEASRFCVSKAFKKRKNEQATIAAIGGGCEFGSLSIDERRTYPHITLALFACLIRASHENDITHWYALLEDPLIRFFTTLGIHFVKIGEPIDIYGLRWPCAIKVSALLDGVATKNMDIWNMFTNEGDFTDFE